jgi:hypothetical protein
MAVKDERYVFEPPTEVPVFKAAGEQEL